MTAAIGSIIRSGSRPRLANNTTARYIATVIISPCAKLTTRTTPKITDRPSAISPYTMPVSTPAMVTLTTRSSGTLQGGLLRLLLCLFIVGDREYRLGFCCALGQHHARLSIQVLRAGREVSFHLALGVELERAAQHGAISDVGLA